MESLGVGPWIAIVVAVGAVGILIGYWLGTRLGGHNTEPMRELHREHKAYKDEVRDHFQQVSATMTRMVDDYREMYQHVAKGAEKLADMHHETVIEPPPKPEAITQERSEPGDETASATKSSAADDDSRKPDARPTSSTQTKAGDDTPKARPDPAGSDSPPSSAPPGEDKQAPSESDKERPKEAAIRAAAEDAATASKR